jgi:hypothetical protein
MERDSYETEVNLSAMDNRELIETAIRRDNLTPLELELTLRLEAFVDLYGDYLREAASLCL